MSNKRHSEEEEQVDPLHEAIEKVQANPLQFIGAVVAVAVLVIAGFLFNINKNIKEQGQASEYAIALDVEDAAARATALGTVAAAKTKYSAEALYMQANAAMDTADYDTAQTAFTQLRANHPDFEFVADSVEGLGAILEAQGDYAGAIARYEEVVSTWPNSFAAQRQPLNIGKCHEANEAPAEAINAYKKQLEVFAGSSVAYLAQQKLDRLYAKNPELEVKDLVIDPIVEN